MGSSVFFAIRDALKAARVQWSEKDGVDGVNGEGKEKEKDVLSLWSPATVERIRNSVGDPIGVRSRVVPREGEKSFFVNI